MKNKYANNLEYAEQSYKVRPIIKSFRDLDVYKNTMKLSAEIFWLEIPSGLKRNSKLKDESEILFDLSKMVPKLIAESHGDKYYHLPMALQKAEKAARVVSNLITKIDFLMAAVDDNEYKEKLLAISKKYQYARPQIINLKSSWENKKGGKNGKQQCADDGEQACSDMPVLP
ncbi:hypothetical protein ACFL4D_02870 [Candidatus Margulisiibacteriota bacterium]